VESDKDAFELLVRNIEENNLKNVISVNLFISSRKKNSIDYIVKKLRLKRVNLIKMDIEGYEYKALKSAKFTLKKFKPKIVIEIHSSELRKKIVKLLSDFGYVLVFEKKKEDLDFYLSYFQRIF
jgi:hypothetical protein